MSESNLNLHSLRLLLSHPRAYQPEYCLWAERSAFTTCILKKVYLTLIKTLILLKEHGILSVAKTGKRSRSVQ